MIKLTQEEKNKKIPRELYANAYIETCIDVFGNNHEKFRLGNFYENKEDLPDYYEIDRVIATHLGAVKLEIEPL